MSNERAKVLVVEDEPVLNELLREVLALEGFDARGALDGSLGLEIARGWLPDVVVLDLMLPDVDGFEICRLLRSNEATAGAGVLVLTALHERSARRRAFDAGADTFLTKPYEPGVVVEAVGRLVEETETASGSHCRMTLDTVHPVGEPDLPDPVEDLADRLRAKTSLDSEQIHETTRAVRRFGQALGSEGHPTSAACVRCWIFRDRVEVRLRVDRPLADDGRDRLRAVLDGWRRDQGLPQEPNSLRPGNSVLLLSRPFGTVPS